MDKIALLAPFMGVDISGLSVDKAAEKVVEAVRDLNKSLNRAGNIPIRLRDTGVTKDSLTALAEAAVEDGTSIYNPREVVAEEILVHLKNAY